MNLDDILKVGMEVGYLNDHGSISYGHITKLPDLDIDGRAHSYTDIIWIKLADNFCIHTYKNFGIDIFDEGDTIYLKPDLIVGTRYDDITHLDGIDKCKNMPLCIEGFNKYNIYTNGWYVNPKMVGLYSKEGIINVLLDYYPQICIDNGIAIPAVKPSIYTPLNLKENVNRLQREEMAVSRGDCRKGSALRGRTDKIAIAIGPVRNSGTAFKI